MDEAGGAVPAALDVDEVVVEVDVVPVEGLEFAEAEAGVEAVAQIARSERGRL